MNRLTGARKKWNWVVGFTAILLVVFVGWNLSRQQDTSRAAGPYTFTNSNGDTVDAGATIEMRRATDTLTLNEYEANDKYEWSSTNETILKIVSGQNSRSVNLQVQDKVGRVYINVKIIHADGTEEVASLTVDVVFSINEVLSANRPTGVNMERIHSSDNRKALIMDYGTSIEFGASAVTEPEKLNLIFGSAKDASAVWSTSNQDVVSINNSQATPILTASGAGRATLSVEFNDGTNRYEDSIYVYVRPQITDENNNVIAGQTNQTQTVEVENGAKLGVSASFVMNPLEGIGDKVIWVISKGEGESTTLVRDSLGNVGSGGENAKLTWLPGEQKYRVDAKAGVYNIQFYVKDTYSGFDEAKNNPPTCLPVSLVAKVLADYEDKNITVNINGAYKLSEALNIPEEVLRDNFTISYGDASSESYLEIDGTVVNAVNLGTGVITVHPNSDVDLPGIPANAPDVKITITVADTFTMNQTRATLKVGATLQLYGVIGSEAVSEADQFHWTTSDASCVSLSADTGQIVTITALKKTDTSKPVTITLTWEDKEGVLHTAYCTVIVTESANSFSITPAAVSLEVGGTSYTLDTKLSGTQNINWISSNTDVATVSALTGSTQAIVSPGKNSGTAVITAINMDNGVFATCLVTVTAPITEISIDKGTSYETTLTEGFVQLKALYKPSNATDTEMNWEITYETPSGNGTRVADIDQNGRVTLIGEGLAHVVVSPKVNPNNVSAYCDIVVRENPITQITPKEKEIDMITGDLYEVAVTLTPENPTDRTLVWSSSDESVATVQGGVITAVKAGTAVISITGGKVGQSAENPPVTIKVNVRNRLMDIAFTSSTKYVGVGETEQLEVVFTPNTDINEKLFWKSSDTSIVTVSDEGLLTGIKIGSAMVSCYAEDMGPENFITCMVYVTDATVTATGLTILPEADTLHVGDTLQMDAVFDPANTTNQELQWSSSKEDIATVNAAGLVTAIAPGQTTITAIYTDTPDGTPWIINSEITVIPAVVEATDFDISPDSKNIKVNETFKLTPVFTPADTTNQTVTYQSLDENVVTVTDQGVVKGVGAGDALIQCQSVSGGFVATCAVHVDNAIKFSLSPATREIAVGKSFTLKKVTVPSSADKTATWKSSNTKIATVSSTGKVTGKKIGSCTITCTLTEYNQSARCKVKVAKLNSKVSLNKKSIRIGLGQTYRLKKTVWTNNSKNPGVTWRSSNKRIATVGSAGKVKAKRIGVTKITVTTKDKVKAKATCRVTVIRRVTSVSLNTSYAVCYVGHTKKLKATVKPKKASIKKLKWSSSNKKIAKVNASGKITGISEGDVTITASATDGSGKKAKCFVKVLAEVPASSIVVAQTEMTMKRGDTAKLSYSVLPNNTSDKLHFASDNKRVATVTSKGKVKAVGTGTATITIMAGSGVSSTVTVNVVALNKASVRMRQYDTETLMVFGTDDTVTWYSSNNRVATVSNGKVVGRSKGSAYIYAFVNGCKLACKVTIITLK